MKVVYAKLNTLVTLPSGVGISIHAGEHWPANDPIVEGHPELFSDDPRTFLRVSVPLVEDERPAEQATAAPGEKRTTRRPRTTSGE